jgi:hypothetical protein
VTFKVVIFKDQNSQTANLLHFLMDKPLLHNRAGRKTVFAEVQRDRAQITPVLKRPCPLE